MTKHQDQNFTSPEICVFKIQFSDIMMSQLTSSVKSAMAMKGKKR